MSGRLIAALVATYPAGWRRRYGTEFSVVLADYLADAPWYRRPALIANTLGGALAARGQEKGTTMDERSPISTAVWAAGLFTVAGITFQKMGGEDALSAARYEHRSVDAAFVAVVACAVIALGALATAALPTLVALLRSRSRRIWALVAVPFVGVAVWVGIAQLTVHLDDGNSIHSAANNAAAAVLGAIGLMVVAATAWAANTVLARVPAPGPPRLRPLSLRVVAAGMAATTLATGGWGLAVHAAHLDTTGAGLIATPLWPSWLAATAVMAAATVLAVRAAWSQTHPAHV